MRYTNGTIKGFLNVNIIKDSSSNVLAKNDGITMQCIHHSLVTLSSEL